VPDDTPATADLEPDERAEAAKQALARLPPETRKALRMKYLDGMVSFCGPLIDPLQPLMPKLELEGMGLLASRHNAEACCGINH